jgi:hypothetical protein
MIFIGLRNCEELFWLHLLHTVADAATSDCEYHFWKGSDDGIGVVVTRLKRPARWGAELEPELAQY